jgi:hypothetical protein
MTTTAGAGTFECQADWTAESVIDDYLADNKLSRRKLAWLEQVYDRALASIEAACSIDIAGSIYCSELELPQGSYWCQCIAAALDFIKPERDSIGRSRLDLLNDRLIDYGFLEPEDAGAMER